MGPSLPKKKSGSASKNTSQRALNSAGRESRSTTSSSIAVGTTHIDSTTTVVPEDNESTLSTSISQTWSDDWNKKRYQREDEELWGRDFSQAGHRLIDAIKYAGNSANRMLETLGKEPREVTEEDRWDFYSTAKNPPVNDYHPPIVSQRPKDKDAAKWMLQPPPPAKIMEGKVPVSRSTSLASQASRRTMASKASKTSNAPPLGRKVQEKMIDAKLRNGEAPDQAELAASVRRSNQRRSTASSRGGISQRTTRSRSLSQDSSDASDEPKKQRRKPRARAHITPNYDSSEDEDYLRGSIDSLGVTTRAAKRPNLPTIKSSQIGHASDKPAGQMSLGAPESLTPQPSPLRDILNSPHSKGETPPVTKQEPTELPSKPTFLEPVQAA